MNSLLQTRCRCAKCLNLGSFNCSLFSALIDIKSTDGQTPLHLACKNSAANSVKVLMKLGANINERDNNMRTPLFAAAEAGISIRVYVYTCICLYVYVHVYTCKRLRVIYVFGQLV